MVILTFRTASCFGPNCTATAILCDGRPAMQNVVPPHTIYHAADSPHGEPYFWDVWALCVREFLTGNSVWVPLNQPVDTPQPVVQRLDSHTISPKPGRFRRMQAVEAADIRDFLTNVDLPQAIAHRLGIDAPLA